MLMLGGGTAHVLSNSLTPGWANLGSTILAYACVVALCNSQSRGAVRCCYSWRMHAKTLHEGVSLAFAQHSAKLMFPHPEVADLRALHTCSTPEGGYEFLNTSKPGMIPMVEGMFPAYSDEYAHNDQTFSEKFWLDPVRSRHLSFPVDCWTEAFLKVFANVVTAFTS